ncbi:hypothetical protein LCGC14_3112010, partial [marine sediment metagenome]
VGGVRSHERRPGDTVVCRGPLQLVRTSQPQALLRTTERTQDIPLGETRFGRESEYWLSFDEWFAEQVARWVSTFDRIPIDSVERLFARIARNIRALFSDAKRRFQAEPEIDAFLQLLQTRERPAINVVAVQNMQANSLDDTAALFSMDESVSAPHTAASAPMRKLFKRLGIKGKAAEKAAADADHFSWIVRWGWNLMQLADKNRHIAGLQRYRELVDAWWVFKMKWINRADTRVREWRALSEKQTNKLAQFLFELDGMNAWPTTEELIALVRKHGLEQPTFDLYERIRDDFTAVLEQMEKTSIRDARASITSRSLQEIEIATIRSEFDAQRASPYFPHSRFGD